MLEFLIDRVTTPIGELIVVADGDGNLRTIDWTEHEARMKQLLDRQYGKGGYTLKPARNPVGLSSAMRRYFDGDLKAIEALAVHTAGTTFQKSVRRSPPRTPCQRSPA